ncbi:unnamed protein product [Pleuronectes platessa]|uniref:Uncharacterized protein n=1 Tax=Pleuronectes platessa TaxID=8262 RepID=A0A9N7YPL8_PLEPL|nr:unnamed protein product [Pleuronectes platessa]
MAKPGRRSEQARPWCAEDHRASSPLASLLFKLPVPAATKPQVAVSIGWDTVPRRCPLQLPLGGPRGDPKTDGHGEPSRNARDTPFNYLDREVSGISGGVMFDWGLLALPVLFLFVNRLPGNVVLMGGRGVEGGVWVGGGVSAEPSVSFTQECWCAQQPGCLCLYRLMVQSPAGSSGVQSECHKIHKQAGLCRCRMSSEAAGSRCGVSEERLRSQSAVKGCLWLHCFSAMLGFVFHRHVCGKEAADVITPEPSAPPPPPQHK